MSEDQPKATRLQKVLVGILLLANICLAILVLSHRQPLSELKKEIPSTKLLSEEAVQSQLRVLAAQSPSGKGAVAMFTSASTNCSTGRLVDVLNTHAKRTKLSRILVLLPSTFTPADVDNFKRNLEVAFAVERADEQLTEIWLTLAAEYEATGVVILTDGNKTTVLQDVSEIDSRLFNFQ